MAKISKPKSAPSIDMTPMVDLAFLLVTFFMLSANFRSDEVVQVDVPSSISDYLIPENTIMVTVDNGGRIYFGMSGKEEAKENVLAQMSQKYKVSFTPAQIKSFATLTDFGCSIQELPAYLDMTSEQRKEYIETGKTMAIPADSSNNQLKDWILFGRNAAMEVGEKAYYDAVSKGAKIDENEFKPKYIIKADGKAAYYYAKKVIEVFRDLNLNNLNFVTSLEADPRKTQQ